MNPINTVKTGIEVISNTFSENKAAICFGGGVACVLLGTIRACIKTPNVYDILDKHNYELNDIEEYRGTGRNGIIYTDKEANKDVGKTYLKTVGSLALNYAEPVAEVFGGIALFAAAYKIQSDQIKELKIENMQLAGALSALDLMFKGYRNRTRDVVGEEKEYEIFHDIKTNKEKEKYIDEKGKEKERDVEKKTVGDSSGDLHSFMFDSFNPHFKAYEGANNVVIMNAEKMFNRMLVGRADKSNPNTYSSIQEKEIWDYFHANDMDNHPGLRLTYGYVYRPSEHRNYKKYDDEPNLPRIVQFGTSLEFAKRTNNETWVDMIDPVNLLTFMNDTTNNYI